MSEGTYRTANTRRLVESAGRTARRVISGFGSVIVGLAVLLPIGVACGPARAGVVNGQTIIGISISTAVNFQGQSGFVVVYLTGSESGRPGCQSNGIPSFAINAGTTAGAAVIAQLIATQAQGRTISVTGTGGCTLTPGVEDLYSTTVN